jgi:hypothetical protein
MEDQAMGDDNRMKVVSMVIIGLAVLTLIWLLYG